MKKQEALNESYKALHQFYQRYHAEAEVRERISRGDTSDLSGLKLPQDMELRVVEQTSDTYYFPLPPPPGAVLSDESLESISGGVMHTGPMGCACVGW